jgi:hypothetical protein
MMTLCLRIRCGKFEFHEEAAKLTLMNVISFKDYTPLGQRIYRHIASVILAKVNEPLGPDVTY